MDIIEHKAIAEIIAREVKEFSAYVYVSDVDFPGVILRTDFQSILEQFPSVGLGVDRECLVIPTYVTENEDIHIQDYHHLSVVLVCVNGQAGWRAWNEFMEMATGESEELEMLDKEVEANFRLRTLSVKSCIEDHYGIRLRLT